MNYNNSPLSAVQSIRLDYCWVCGIKDVPFEQHHIVPRHCGGEKGPTVTLCGGCHTTIHNAAEKIKKGNPTLPLKNQTQRERVLYLATVIANAELALQKVNLENKRVVYSGFFEGATHTKLVKLSRFYKMSQHKLLVHAINTLYMKSFND